MPRRSRPCLNFQLDRCLGPCTQDVSNKYYMDIANRVRLFLEGNNRELIRDLKRDMERASGRQEYEEAARIRDQIMAVEKTMERQNVVSSGMEDQDVIGIVQTEGISQLVILFVRKGYLTGSRDYRFSDRGASGTEVLESFLKQYYHGMTFIPKKHNCLRSDR